MPSAVPKVAAIRVPNKAISRLMRIDMISREKHVAAELVGAQRMGDGAAEQHRRRQTALRSKAVME